MGKAFRVRMVRQATILKGSLGLVLLLTTISCATQKAMQLGEAAPRYKDYQGTDLDPLVDKKEFFPKKTSNAEYDDYLAQARKAITSLQFAERTALVIDTKRATSQPYEKEEKALDLLEEDLPSIVKSIPELQKKGEELLDRVPNDFEGPKIGQVSSDLNKTNEDLRRVAPIAPGILQSLRDLRSDITSEELKASKSNEIQPTKNDPIEPPVVALPKEELKPKEKNKDWKKFLPQEEKKDTLVIKRVPNKKKITGSTKDFLQTEPISPAVDNLSEEERKEKNEEEMIRKGLVEVFKSEYYRSAKSLEKILLNHPIPRVRSAAALALGRINAGRTSLQRAIDKDGYQVRPAAYKALADIGDKRSLSYFIAGTKAEDPEVVAASFEGIGKSQDPAGRELILNQGITSDYVVIVAGSIRGLAYNHLPNDLELIEKFLKSEEDEIAEAAIEALAIHNSREALRILERSVSTYPKLAFKILDEIGKSPKLAATFSLIRLNESLSDENLQNRIGEHLLRRKAFGKYSFIQVENDFLRKDPNERSAPVSYIKTGEIGLVLSETKKEFAVRMDESIVTDKYLQIKMENSIPSAKSGYVTGWVFYPKVEVIEIKKLGSSSSGKYSHTKTGKHQNLFNPEDRASGKVIQ